MLPPTWQSFIDRRIRGWREFDFFIEPVAHTGFGDRLLELWAALTIAELLRPGAKTAIRWTEAGIETPAFVTEYAPLFSIDGCTLVGDTPFGASDVARERLGVKVSGPCVRRLPVGPRQIQLKYGRFPGATDPWAIRKQARFYGLRRKMPIETIAEAYRRVAASTRPAPDVADCIPADIDQRIGVHVRRSDKLVADEEGHNMNLTRWQTIEQAGLAYVDRCVDAGEKVFVCSDDTDYRDRLLRRVRDRGGDAIVHDPAPGLPRPAGFDALVDFFALARCRRVVQVTRYSHFSLMPAIIGGLDLVNFDPPEGRADNALGRWGKVVSIRWDPEADPVAAGA